MTIHIKANREQRRIEMRETLRQNPMLTDSDLAEMFSVSKATIRLDRQALGIPQMRERMEHVVQNEMSSSGVHHENIEILQMTSDRNGLALLEITDDMLDESGYVPAERLYGIAIGLARKLVGGRLEATQVGNIKYKKPVTAGTKLIIKMKVARMRQEKKYIYIVMDDKETEVFRAKFIANIASKGR